MSELGNEIWEFLFSEFKGDVPDVLTEEVCASAAEAVVTAYLTLCRPEAASVITKQADEIERLTRRIGDLDTLIAAQHGDVVVRTAKLLYGKDDRIAVLEAALRPFAALLKRIPMAADHVEIAAINGDLVEAFVDECLSLTIGDFRAARNSLVTP